MFTACADLIPASGSIAKMPAIGCQTPLAARLAPSPTGDLHLGNIWTFLLGWLAARASGGRIFLRIDDLDPQRSKEHFIASQIADLEWLGLYWDGKPVKQSQRQRLYESALARITDLGLIYPCFCTRKELKTLASAPHPGEACGVYSGKCFKLDKTAREKLIAQGKSFSLRIHCGEAPIAFSDLLQGRMLFSKTAYGGDFPLRRSDGVWAYQLATVMDDADMGVNFICRGKDLLSSTPRQLVLYSALGLQAPLYAHAPLLLDENGQKLSKRHQSLSLRQLKSQGVPPQEIIGQLGKLAGLNDSGAPCSAAELIQKFNMRRLPRDNFPIRAGIDANGHLTLS